jgi:hypothetical protein
MARDQEKGDSVYDFLYVDRKRIAFYLSQFDDYGHLTQLTRSVSEHVETGGGLDAKIAKIDTKEGAQTSIQKHYDTQWVAPLLFLDRARGIIARGLKKAAIGKLVLTSGALHIVNMRAFEKTWGVMSSPSSPAAPAGNRQQRRAAGHHQPTKPDKGDMGLKILSSLEQPVFMIAQADDVNLWSTLDPDALIGGSSDLNLKHGERIAGDWHIVSILDCYPDTQKPANHTIARICGTEGNEFGEAALNIWNELKNALGRPPHCFGVTPLLIMREIT